VLSTSHEVSLPPSARGFLPFASTRIREIAKLHGALRREDWGRVQGMRHVVGGLRAHGVGSRGGGDATRSSAPAAVEGHT
jgi:hypothetical protein